MQGNVGNTRAEESTPDMQHAIDILKRSSLEVELAAKEGEVRQQSTIVAKLFSFFSLSVI